MDYLLNRKVGYDKDQVLLIQDANVLGKNASAFKNELLQLSNVRSASVGGYLPIKGTKRNSKSFANEGKKTVDKSVQAQVWRVDHDYVKTLGITIVSGRDFSPDRIADSSAIIINQTMAKALMLNDPIGKGIETSRIWNIIGVVEDFHFESLRDNIGPLALILGRETSTISVKLHGGDIHNVLESVTGTWKKFSPNQPIRYTFLDESFARLYSDVQRMGRIFTSFAVLAILVACLGLFALSSFMVEQRGKEIAIRLVVGSSTEGIVAMLTANFLKLVFIATAIAIPIGWYSMNNWLYHYAYRTEITWDVFALSGTIAIVVALVTVSFQSIKAAIANPVKGLRSE